MITVDDTRYDPHHIKCITKLANPELNSLNFGFFRHFLA